MSETAGVTQRKKGSSGDGNSTEKKKDGSATSTAQKKKYSTTKRAGGGGVNPCVVLVVLVMLFGGAYLAWEASMEGDSALPMVGNARNMDGGRLVSSLRHWPSAVSNHHSEGDLLFTPIRNNASSMRRSIRMKKALMMAMMTLTLITWTILRWWWALMWCRLVCSDQRRQT